MFISKKKAENPIPIVIDFGSLSIKAGKHIFNYFDENIYI
jgi:hypothetical protein